VCFPDRERKRDLVTDSKEGPLKASDNIVPRGIFGQMRNEAREWKKSDNDELNKLCSWPNIIIKSSSMSISCTEHVARS
jgi:hypothetical protein